ERDRGDLVRSHSYPQLRFLGELGVAQALPHERNRLVVFAHAPTRRAAYLLQQGLSAREQSGRRPRLTEGGQRTREPARIDREPPSIPGLSVQANGFLQQRDRIRRPIVADRKSGQTAQRQRLHVRGAGGTRPSKRLFIELAAPVALAEAEVCPSELPRRLHRLRRARFRLCRFSGLRRPISGTLVAVAICRSERQHVQTLI